MHSQRPACRDCASPTWSMLAIPCISQPSAWSALAQASRCWSCQIVSLTPAERQNGEFLSTVKTWISQMLLEKEDFKIK